MQTSITGEGVKQINLKEGEVVRITSDQHIPVGVMASLVSKALKGSTNYDPYERRVRFMLDLLTAPIEGGVSHQLINGDMIHTNALPKRRGPQIRSAWENVTELIQKQDLTGETHTLIPGNHTRTELMPQETQDQLINRGILIPAGKAVIRNTPQPQIETTTLHVLHGREFDALSHRRYLLDENAHIQAVLWELYKIARLVTGTRYFPFGNNIMEVMSLLTNAPQMVHAEQGLGENDWAIDGHTHMPQLRAPNHRSQEPDRNMLSRDNLEKLLTNTPLALLLLKIAAKTIPNLTGIDKYYVTATNRTGFANSGFWDPITQILSGLDVSNTGIDLFLANVNGGYEPDMLKKLQHPSINLVGSALFNVNRIEQ